MGKEILIETLIEEFTKIQENTINLVRRDITFSEAPHMIHTAIGMRRTGKTYLLFQTIHDLLKEKVAKEQILYINFEDDRLLPMTDKQMGELIDSFYALYPENYDRICYLFLDEVQNVEGWPLVVRRQFDSKKIKLFLTGSSAKLLSKEIASSLRGRSLAAEVWPFSLQEFFRFHNIPPLERPIGEKKINTYRKYLEEYLIQGGFPAVQNLSINDKRTLLQSYVDSVVFRDVIERYHITNTSLIKYLIKVLLKNCAAPFSINKFYKDIKSQGYHLGKDTLYHYMNYLEDAFLAFSVPFFTESIRQREVNPKKIYAVDTGLINAYLLASDNFGPLFENLIYLDLRRNGAKIAYYVTKNNFEVDFIAQYPDGKMEMLQACWDISRPEVLMREERALKEAEQELGIPGRIIDPIIYLKNSV